MIDEPFSAEWKKGSMWDNLASFAEIIQSVVKSHLGLTFKGPVLSLYLSKAKEKKKKTKKPRLIYI